MTGEQPDHHHDTGADYQLRNDWARARQRLTALEGWLDARSREHLRARGVRRGWSCLEVGAGGGSVAAWLAEEVGANGRVLATDIDPRFLDVHTAKGVEARRHDIAHDPLPTEAFDLVHCRLLLAHLARPDQALARMTGALRPGGWLVAEEMDFATVAPEGGAEEDRRAFVAAVAAHNALIEGGGVDVALGRHLADGLRRVDGLSQVGADAASDVRAGGAPAATAWRLTFVQLRERLLDAGGLSAADLDTAVRLCDDPGFTFRTQTVVSAWGRREGLSPARPSGS